MPTHVQRVCLMKVGGAIRYYMLNNIRFLALIAGLGGPHGGHEIS
jgi:predicted transcriptional regulator